ncbi:MAG: DNA repair protein RecO C-terminal domain-containing protein, partial [Anaerohalosphaera sp.]|nr:DNA repair protein RecO C-terminal domain-containing protein [Anaerohalosphaera sp.]
PHPELFDGFVRFLTDVQTASDNAEALSLLIIFQLTVLGEFGSALVLNRCVNCSSSWNDSVKNIYFCSTANGLICADCEGAFVDKLRLSKPVADCLTQLRNLKNADERLLRGVEKVIIYHLTEILHKRPKMAKYFTASASQ